MNTLTVNAINRLIEYCEKEGYKGWDPYDGLNSKVFQKLPLISKSRFFKLAWIQFFKRSPVNFRRLLGVDKDYNAKGVALFITGYVNLAHTGIIDDSKTKIDFLAKKLLDSKANGYSGSCWGYNFDWQSKAFFQPKNSPTIVVSTFAANALIDAYELTGNQEYLNEAITTKDFIIKDLNRTYDRNNDFAFSYSPHDHTSVFNASLLGAKLLARIYSYSKEPELLELAKKAVSYCCTHQNADGSWYYSTLPFHQWIDNFHTGFNLECIIEYRKYSGDHSFDQNISKGMNYYLKTFFDKEGRSKYYNNSLYPIDIHAPSQLFVVLSKANRFEENKALANKVMDWTIHNMQSSDGYFYYQKRKYFTNKIPYMRWSQAWIFYGMSYYLLNGYDKNK